MPVKAVGKKIVEVSSGKVVGTAKTHKDAVISAGIRNIAYERKGMK